MHEDDPLKVKVTYTNHRGETADRNIIPVSISFQGTEWHPEPQWTMFCFDVDKQEHRTFALGGIQKWPAVEQKTKLL